MIKIKNKKADLLNNILTTVIAVVGLAIIFYAGLRLYSVYANQEETNAQKTIDTIETKINSLNEGKNYSTRESLALIIRGIPGWFMTVWSKDDIQRPDKCYFKSCICICENGDLEISSVLWGNTIFLDRMPGLCQKKGFCRLFNADKISFLGQTFRVDVEESEFGRLVIKPLVIFDEDKSNLVELSISKYFEEGKHTIGISL